MELFKFDNHELNSFINFKLCVPKKMKKAFHYINEKIGIQTKNRLSKLTWFETKNYNWAAFKRENFTFLVRQYGCHFTFYGYIEYENDYLNEMFGFTFYSETNKLSGAESDKRVDDSFFDIDNVFDSMFKDMREGHVYSLSFNAKVRELEHVEIKRIFKNKEIYSYDLLVFASEEISNLERDLFAENEMFEKIKTMNVGDKVGKYEVLQVFSELKNEYYHGVGLKLNDKSYIKDVYDLTQWYFEDIFPKENLVE